VTAVQLEIDEPTLVDATVSRVRVHAPFATTSKSPENVPSLIRTSSPTEYGSGLITVATPDAPTAGMENEDVRYEYAGNPSWSSEVPASIAPPMLPELIVRRVTAVGPGTAATTKRPDSEPSLM
jgi:hypothetical protein